MKHLITTAIFALVLVNFGLAEPTTDSTAAPNLPALAVIRLDGDPQKALEAERGKEVRLGSANATTFKVLPGLKGPGLVSLEAVDSPGAYVRHKDAIIWLHGRPMKPKKLDLLFEGNASFKLIHLEGDKYRFEASGLAERFITVKKDGALILALNPPPEQSTFVLAPVGVTAKEPPAPAPAQAAASAPTVAGPAPLPSSQIEPLLEPSLNAILAPLAENPQMPRVPVEKLRASLGAGAVKARTPSQKQIYQYAMAVCEALTKGMDDRAETRAAAVASGTLPSITTGGSIIKSAPIRGWDAGHAGDAIRKKQKDERDYADNQAKGASNFMESSAYKAWVTRSTALRENVMGLYGKLVQLEAQEPAHEAAAGAAAPPAAN